MRLTRGDPALLLVLAAGCAAPRAGSPVSPTSYSSSTAPRSAEAADVVSDVIAAALAADATLLSADSLYSPSALIVADGQHRSLPPRFAGVEAGGQVNIASSQVEIARGFAWAYVEYRWLSTKSNLAREGRATLVLVPGKSSSSWIIVHANSSAAR